MHSAYVPSSETPPPYVSDDTSKSVLRFYTLITVATGMPRVLAARRKSAECTARCIGQLWFEPQCSALDYFTFCYQSSVFFLPKCLV